MYQQLILVLCEETVIRLLCELKTLSWFLFLPSTFDRMLDAKLREEELTIPALRPSPDQYK